jgi:hypothetical protein
MLDSMLLLAGALPLAAEQASEQTRGPIGSIDPTTSLRYEDVLDAAGLEFSDSRGADHSTISYHTHSADPKSLAQTINDRQQRLHVSGIAGPSR